ncbi:DUF3152 domain-containing protein [Streptomyces sp. NPDC051907]|uniref:DUF3152 domain-containing protein n=1 Tax=Streptomyces sp. NPDC051907 TaxID=3155284 RepID=UPI003436DF01
MGRHSRKGPAPKGSDAESKPSGIQPGEQPGAGPRAGRRRAPEPHTPAGYTVDQTRGGHPEQHEAGGGWGAPQGYDGRQGAAPRTQTPPPGFAGGARIPGPRREFVEAFDQQPSSPQQSSQQRPPSQRPPSPGEPQSRFPSDPYAPLPEGGAAGPGRSFDAEADPETGEPEKPAKGVKGRALTGIAAAAVTTVLAVVVAGQVTADSQEKPGAQAAGDNRDIERSPASRDGDRLVPPQRNAPEAAAPPSYDQLMAAQFPLEPKLKGSGDFEAVPGFDKAPGKGTKIRYRVDIEKGLGLDGTLFADAVQKTLNDERSWAHGGAMTFERVSSGEPEFVITLASPGTTAIWCAKSDLDVTVSNVSCDSAQTERVMINAYRWAQGASTYGPKAMHSYRQMLINHEVGHRLKHDHENCRTPGSLAPVMQQQTKSLNVDGIACKPNPWVHPEG